MYIPHSLHQNGSITRLKADIKNQWINESGGLINPQKHRDHVRDTNQPNYQC